MEENPWDRVGRVNTQPSQRSQEVFSDVDASRRAGVVYDCTSANDLRRTGLKAAIGVNGVGEKQVDIREESAGALGNRAFGIV